MGKNQQHKQRQMSRAGGGGGGEDGVDAGGMVDASFHTAEWHAARLASLTVERPSWEDWKQKQKEDELREEEALAKQDRLMREYKEGLEEDRAKRMGLVKDGGVRKKKEKKEKKRKRKSKDKDRKRSKSSKDKKKHSKKHSSSSRSKKRRRSSSSDSDSSGSSGSSTSGSESDSESGGSEGGGGKAKPAGPVKLSEFLYG